MGSTADPTKKTDRPKVEKQPIKKPPMKDLSTPDKKGEAVKGGKPTESL